MCQAVDTEIQRRGSHPAGTQLILGAIPENTYCQRAVRGFRQAFIGDLQNQKETDFLF